MEVLVIQKINDLLATDYSREEILGLWEEIMECYDNLFSAAIESHGIESAWFVVENTNSEFIALMEEVQERIEWSWPNTIS
jgi:hypothetical protein